MTEPTYRAAVVFLLSAVAFCLALLAGPAATIAPAWQSVAVNGILIVGAVGMAAAGVLFVLAALPAGGKRW